MYTKLRVEAERPNSELGRLRNDNLSQTKPRRIEGLRRNRAGVTRRRRVCLLLQRLCCRYLSQLQAPTGGDSFRDLCREQAHGSGKKTTLDHISVGLRCEKAREQLVPRPVSSVTGSEPIGSLATGSMTSFDAEVILSNDGNYSELKQAPNPW